VTAFSRPYWLLFGSLQVVVVLTDADRHLPGHEYSLSGQGQDELLETFRHTIRDFHNCQPVRGPC